MNNNIYISTYCKINRFGVLVNNETIYQPASEFTFAEYMKDAFKQQGFNYLKYFKMDNISKLGFLTTEILLKNTNLKEKYTNEEIGVIISNSNSTLDTDNDFNQTIIDRENYFPSPSVFVYTLPNIMIGEICIKNKIQGESTFFVSEKFNADLTCSMVSNLLKSEKTKACIAGWVDLSVGVKEFDSFLMLIEKGKSENLIEFNKENLNKLHQIK
jgi:3-oxoacyl-(acyl-carrier-protein) synthase